MMIFLLFSIFPVWGKESTPHFNHHRVLFIGDSHSVGLFGRTLTALMQENFPKVVITTVASCGSDPRWWLEGKTTHCGLWTRYPNGFDYELRTAPTPKISNLLQIVKPKVTLVALGSNLVPLSEQERIASTEALMHLIETKGGQCVWVSAPDSRKFKATDLNDVYLMLKTLAKKHHCKLIDSRKYTKYPSLGGDGLHYGGKEGSLIATQWAQKIFSVVMKPQLSKTFGVLLAHKKN